MEFNNRGHYYPAANSSQQISHSAYMIPSDQPSRSYMSPSMGHRQHDYDNAKRKHTRSFFSLLATFPHRFKLSLLAAVLISFYLLVPSMFWYLKQLREASPGSFGDALKSNLTVSVDSILKSNEELDFNKEQETARSRYLSQLERIEDKLLEQSETFAQMSDDFNNKAEEVDALRTKLKSQSDTLATMEKMLKEEGKLEQFVDGSKQKSVSKRFFKKLPASSVYCQGTTKLDRICKIHNLYYYPERNLYFIVLSRESVLHNVPDMEGRKPTLIEMVTIENHSVFYWDFEEAIPESFEDALVNVVEKRTFMFSRFHMGNIMHTLHDDILGLYHVMKQHAERNTTEGLPEYASFSLDHYIQFFDDYPRASYTHLFELLTDHPLRYKSDLLQNRDQLTCFEEIIVGNSKKTTWYQYGFFEPQGPIKDKHVDGNHVRQAVNFIKYRLGLSDNDPEIVNQKPYLSVFSRTKNRLVLNEDDLLQSLANQYDLNGTFVRMEDMDFETQVKTMMKTKVAVGMHGSILIMAMFLNPGSVLIECYPYAVPSENYTPYKTMAGLPGMDIAYRAWENKYEDANIMYPDRASYEGGLTELSKEERQKVLDTKTVPSHLCCTSPYWLFRIYQDTKINVPEVSALIQDSLKDSENKLMEWKHYIPKLKPTYIDGATIRCIAVSKDDKIIGVRVTWKAPWNGVPVEEYNIWEHLAFTETSTKATFAYLTSPKYVDGADLGVYVRTVSDNGANKGPYCGRMICTLKLKDAVSEDSNIGLASES